MSSKGTGVFSQKPVFHLTEPPGKVFNTILHAIIGDRYPVQLAELVEDMKKLDADTLAHISAIVKEIINE